MGRYRKNPVVIEAITFDELVEYGKEHCGIHQHEGMPWSFDYKGHPITHENDECYLIPTMEGTMKMTTTDMLITGVRGEIYPCKLDIFESTYEQVDESGEARFQIGEVISHDEEMWKCVAAHGLETAVFAHYTKQETHFNTNFENMFAVDNGMRLKDNFKFQRVQPPTGTLLEVNDKAKE